MSSKDRLVQQRFNEWFKQFGHTRLVRQAEALPLRRDMVTVLTFVRDNKVVGTQSTGNMPLKAVRQVTANFVTPPQLDTTIGDHTYRLRSEADIWPLYYLHILAEVGGLVAIAPARRWRLTAHGHKFLETQSLMQVMILLTTWWYQVNWLVAYPVEGMGEALPPGFNLVTLAHLRSLPVGKPISFEPFAERLIEQTGLRWSKDVSGAPMFLRGALKRMVIDILTKFGGIEGTYRDKPLGKGTISELETFEITPLGKAELEAMAILSD